MLFGLKKAVSGIKPTTCGSKNECITHYTQSSKELPVTISMQLINKMFPHKYTDITEVLILLPISI